jgi:hypothetical protein
VFLGNELSSYDTDNIGKHNIKCVISFYDFNNCPKYDKQLVPDHLRINMMDRETEDISRYFNQTSHLIRK